MRGERRGRGALVRLAVNRQGRGGPGGGNDAGGQAVLELQKDGSPWFVWRSTGRAGRSRVSEPTLQDKPFQISKWTVWEAFGRVKANKGAAGVDDQSIAEFEQDLNNNLYRLWNRLSSSSYFPPPVKAVEIPKAGGNGIRVLGVPTVDDRIAQTVARMY